MTRESKCCKHRSRLHASDDWRPTAGIETLRLRADLIATIRAFFERRGVLEVDTPILAAATVPDRHIHSFEVRPQWHGASPPPASLYLQTSPEAAMKRLLAAGSGSIFQICKAFRDAERGRYHNPEFTLLEWYRLGFDHHRLMDEVETLVGELLGHGRAVRMRYAEAFARWADLDIETATEAELSARAAVAGVPASTIAPADRDTCLDLLWSHVVQPSMDAQPVFIYDFPASQAALARVRAGNPPHAERFELFVERVELANGYHELADAAEQRRRFTADRHARARLGLPDIAADRRLLAALAHGLPDCAGVALGVDRVVMLAARARAIEDVITFPSERA